MRKPSCLVLFAALFAACVFASAAQAQTTWKCYTYLPAATDPLYVRLLKLADEVNEATKGQLKMTCNVGGSISIKTNTMVQAVSENVLQFGMADSAAYNGFIPISGLLSLPGIYSNDTELKTGFATLRPKLEEALSKKNVILLGKAHYPRQVFWGVDKITSLKDIEGLKVRVTTPEMAEFVKRFGGLPVMLGPPEVAPALQSGLVKGVLTASSGGGTIWREHFKSTLRIGSNYVTIMLVVNKTSFEKLPAETRSIVTALAVKAGDEMTESLHSREDALTDKFASEGMVVTPGSAADLKTVEEKMKPYWAEWARAKGPEAAAALDAVMTALNKSH